ncbi:MAG: restriction endonuclease subunit S [Cellvibrionaceae bacterium]
MIEFNSIKIGNLGNVITGRTPKTSVPENFGNDFMFVGPTDLHKHFVISSSEKMISKTGLATIKSATIEGLSICVGCIGWDMGNVGLVNGKCATNQQINSITNIKNDYNPYYIYYWLKGKKDYLFQQASVTRTPILNKSSFSDIEISVPPKNYQDSVADLLTAIDKKIELNNKINAELEAMAKLIYDYWFVQFDFPDANGKPYKSSGGKMVYNQELKREIPEDWGDTTLGDICDLYQPQTISGKEMRSDGKYLVYGANGIVGKYDKFNHEQCVVTITCRGNTCGTINTTRPFSWITGNAMVAKPRLEFLSIDYILNSLCWANVSTTITGSAQPQITRANLAPLKLVAPDSIVIQKYSNLVTVNYARRLIALEENEQLIELRDWLLPMLMNGQVTVNN